MGEKPLIVVLSYPGPEHRAFLQANLNGIALALEAIGEIPFSLEYMNIVPEGGVVNSVVDRVDRMGALAIIGPFDSETADLVIPSATKLGIPVLSTGASSPLLHNGNLSATTFFRFGGSDEENVRQLVHLLAVEHPGGTILVVAEERSAAARYGDDNLSVLQRLAGTRYLGLIPIRYPRGFAKDAIPACRDALRTKAGRVSAVVALGYTADTVPILRALSEEHPSLSMYTINPQRAQYESSGLEGIIAVASDLEYASTPLRQTFQRQFESRFYSQKECAFHGSAIFAHDLIYILASRLADAQITKADKIRPAREKLIRQLCDSHVPVAGTIVSNGIFTANHEIPFHSRNVVLRHGVFVEYDGSKRPRKWRVFSKKGRTLWKIYKVIVQHFSFVKSNLELWVCMLGLISAGIGIWILGLNRLKSIVDLLRKFISKAM